MKTLACVATVVMLAGSVVDAKQQSAALSSEGETTVIPPATLEDAQRSFYNGRYDVAAELTLHLCGAEPDNLEPCELRTSILHSLIRRGLGDGRDRDAAWKACAVCPDLKSAFVAETTRAQAIARARLKKDPRDEATLFLLGKIDLNYVWLQLGTLGHRTGWDEYWEARKSLDQVLKQNPNHVRARVARAWIDYIVDTKMARGTKWILGGGNRKRGLQVVRAAATGEAEFFEWAEATFALWDMQVREKDIAAAVVTARDLARRFPENRDLARFLNSHSDVKP